MAAGPSIIRAGLHIRPVLLRVRLADNKKGVALELGKAAWSKCELDIVVIRFADLPE